MRVGLLNDGNALSFTGWVNALRRLSRHREAAIACAAGQVGRKLPLPARSKLELRGTGRPGFFPTTRRAAQPIYRVRMNKIVDRVMLLAAPPSALMQSELRKKVFGYIELLASTGKRDPDELTVLGAEFLRKIVDGPDPRFTGC
jgi:hypothetical protein